MTAGCVGFVQIGPEWHGVARFGRLLERAARGAVRTTTVRRLGSGALEHGEASAPQPTVWFAQFTDHLLGSTPAQAAHAMAQLRDELAPSHLVVTLHDLPGATSTPARRSAYRRVAAAAAAVVVCSEHERTLLRGCGFDGPVVVIPHFVEARPMMGSEPSPSPRRSERSANVAVLGFLYPGKGHMAVLEACSRAAADVRLLALGAPSPGHAHLAEELLATGRRLDVGCTVTGWLDEDDLDDQLTTAGIPVTAHEAISASSSVATWIAAGRRPLVPSGPYMAELLAAAPGVVTTYDPGDPDALAERIDAAFDDPASTYHAGVPDHLSLDATVRRYLTLAR